MREFIFTLEVPGATELTEELESTLYEAGCADAVLWSREGKVFLDFARKARTMREAVNSALANIESARIPA